MRGRNMTTIIIDLNDPIEITKDVKLTLKAIRGNVTTLVIDAPRNIHILRTELKKDETLKKQHFNRNNELPHQKKTLSC